MLSGLPKKSKNCNKVDKNAKACYSTIMFEKHLPPKKPNYPLRQALAGTVLGGLLLGTNALGVMNDKEPQVSAQEKERIEEIKETVNTLPRDEHLINVVAEQGDSPWSIVDRVAKATGFDGDLRPEVDRVALEPQVQDRLQPGEIVQVDLDNLQK